MKRSEVKVGETYAVMSPSQKVGNAYRSARKVTVLDTEPVWKETYSRWSTTEDTVAVKNADGKAVKAIDRAVKVKANSYRSDTAKRSILVVEEKTNWEGEVTSYIRTAVPLAQVRMTWAEYELATDQAERDRKRLYEARRKADQEHQNRKAAAAALRDALTTKLEGTPFTARVLDGEVVLAGPYNELVKLVTS